MRAGRARHSRGVALVTAMLVAALAAAVAATLASSQSQWMRSVELRRAQVQAQAIVLAGLDWSRQAILDDTRNAAAIDHRAEPWAMPLPPTPLEGGSVEGRIIDAQGLINLNNLAFGGDLATAERGRLARLFAAQGITERSVDQLVARLAPPAPEAAAGTPSAAARAPNKGLTRSAEIVDVPGVGYEGFARLAPSITALPTATPLNVNTASDEVLASALPGLGAEGLAALVADRARKPYASIADFRNRLPQPLPGLEDHALAVKSDYFIVTVRARQAETLAQGRALMRRRTGELPQVIWQTIE